jgi:acetyl/propionyl-CoA carboxylase alpha subunit
VRLRVCEPSHPRLSVPPKESGTSAGEIIRRYDNLTDIVGLRPIKNLLVANRGEIALRIIRTARVLGIKTVAVYSEADAHSAHVLAADDARRIGPSEPALSYLNTAALIEAAGDAGADAIHPGYGFLSERPEFARAATDSGLIFVGPSAEVMAAVGDKVAARRLAAKADVPVVPGIETADVASARRFAAHAQYPILVKAAAGGGGRGMRVVEDEANLEDALEAASREAQAAFGDGRIFIEKYLARPRHIEIQMLADSHGTIIALGERECSIQRRHQKIIEESPAPGLSQALRDRMAEAAVRVGRAARYRNAGTAEFLVDGDNFYFLEVNARLQVEHPVTELRFGCDLVAEQLRIAAGEPLSPPLEPRGCAIECRINAEDAEHDFRPASGRVAALALPSGPGVRVDTHLTAGADVPPYYDSLIAKVITFGADREMTRGRMAAALEEFALLGVVHTGAFLRAIIASEPFACAQLSTRFLPEHFPRWGPSDRDLRDAAIAAFMATQGLLGSSGAADSYRNGGGEHPDTPSRSPWNELAGFTIGGGR